MIYVNGKIRPNISATRHFQPFSCPSCNDGMVFTPTAEKCNQCLRYEADQAREKKNINDLHRANRRAGK